MHWSQAWAEQGESEESKRGKNSERERIDREERAMRYFDDPRMQRQQRLQEDVARMAIIDKDIEAIGKKAAYVEKMVEIYMKTRENLVAKFGQEWFDNKISETVSMLPDVNKSLLGDHADRDTMNNDEEGSSSLE